VIRGVKILGTGIVVASAMITFAAGGVSVETVRTVGVGVFVWALALFVTHTA
jgi:hypothetical protein